MLKSGKWKISTSVSFNIKYSNIRGCISRKCSDHCCSSKSVVYSSVFKTCVVLISEPFYITFLLSPDRASLCYYSDVIYEITAVVFCGVSIQTITAISVDRLLALSLDLRYRQFVTIRRVRVLVIMSWLFSSAASTTYLFNELIHTSIACIGITGDFLTAEVIKVVHSVYGGLSYLLISRRDLYGYEKLICYGLKCIFYHIFWTTGQDGENGRNCVCHTVSHRKYKR